ncbi:PASTA domain-containing protein [Streptococcus moroccensis]|uniref:Serine/threonine-protein kinase n=1 Tax=Streptococcus moroccensis TaxID=1451356 RepID=A0ABT9YRP1_9STRE|nr:PASTA domain-containing protein [Streptococcus moroccensis]MDQ0221780.1 serine/threonine-protein kinase [Streptococcus moroccensis]
MSNDFLSKFSGKNYDDLLEEDKKKEAEPATPNTIATPISFEKEKSSKEALTEESQERFKKDPPQELTEADKNLFSPTNHPRSRGNRYRDNDLYEVDPTYKTKKATQKRALIAGVALAVLLALFLVYRMTHVAIPDFTGQTISEAREWGVKNRITLDMDQVFSLEQDVNHVISQSSKPKKRVRKGSTVLLTVSKGADPNELLVLPDFDKLSAQEAEEWINQHKAENLTLKKEFSETVEANQLISFEINASDVTVQDYKRGDKATVIYSRGKENLEKNIDVPDFTDKAKSEVDSWAKKHQIKVTYTDQASDSSAVGNIIAQSTAPNEKVAKKDAIEVFVSVGKGITVPNFATLTPEAAANANGLTVTVHYQFNPTLRYGSLISQSIEAGKQLAEKESKNILVIYSQGTPYLKDIRGKKSSELAKYFFDEYQSRGAEVTYETYWVNSAEPRGTVVEQSDYEVPIPMNYHVYVGISNGVWASPTIIPEVPVETGLGSSGQTNDSPEITE